MRKILPIALAVLLFAGLAFATEYEYYGNGQGDEWNGCVPFSPWEGVLTDNGSSESFSGYWGFNPNDNNYIRANDSQISDGPYAFTVTNGTWYYEGVEAGTWSGAFLKQQPGGYISCSGTWEVRIDTVTIYDGTWWGGHGTGPE